VVAAAGGLFAHLVRYPFLPWDDDLLLLRHTEWRGLGPAQLRFMWSTTELGHRVPLTWLSWALDHAVWGLWPGGYHLTNVLIHAANAGLVYALGRTLLSRRSAPAEPALTLGAGLAALLFAVHPLRVETVSWITERRGLLSALLVLLATALYLGAVERDGASRVARLGGSAGLFALALLAKSSVVSWPAALLVLDWYPLGRLGSPGERRRALREKLVYLPPALAAAALSYQAQTAGWDQRVASGPERILNAAYTLASQLGRTLVPAGLSPLYEAPAHLDLREPRFAASALAVLALTVLFVALARRWPAGLAAWLGHAALLAPVLGLVPLGDILTADRYSYLAGLGWAWLAGAGLVLVLERGRRGLVGARAGRAVVTGAGVVVLGLAVLAVQQSRVWRDGRSLWERALRVDPRSGLPHAQLANLLEKEGDVTGALAHHRRAAAARPGDGRVLLGLGRALLQAGDPAGALPVLVEAERRRPTAEAHVSLGLARSLTGDRDTAILHYRTAIALDPRVAAAHNNLGILLLQEGRADEAAASFRQALRAAPDLAEAQRNLRAAEQAAGR
jgi:Tfp pilus assembly protein PilF